MKEDMMPSHVDKPVFFAAPAIILVPSLVLFAPIPFGKSFVWNGQTIHLQIADLNVGIIFLLAVASLGVYGIVLGAWASNSKYPLLGGLRASAQMISYELAMGLSIITVVLITSAPGLNGLSLEDIVAHQAGYWLGFIPQWNVFANPFAFVIFLVCIFAETNRLPFDFAEAEQELVGGYHTEYSSMKFSAFMLAEYHNMMTLSMLMVVFFFGGWHLPGVEAIPSQAGQVLASVGVFGAKTVFFCFLFLWVRWTLPRLRYDKLMAVGWKVLLPFALVTCVGTALWLAYVV